MMFLFFPIESQHLLALYSQQRAQQYLCGISVYLKGTLGPFSAITDDSYYRTTKRRGRNGTPGNLGLVGAPLPSFICLYSVKQDIQNCQILAVFTSPMAAWKAWVFFFKRFSKTVSPLFSFLLKNTRKLENRQSLAVIHTSRLFCR